ncbi:hypothetical protein [Ferrimonas pelagia]|uniref:STAS/SEC14 domain-containing protein n=1 Tax=Ferrimonas pelagia TaxID=1177826 RepID=A0ABP9EJL2_9GAMM
MESAGHELRRERVACFELIVWQDDLFEVLVDAETEISASQCDAINAHWQSRTRPFVLLLSCSQPFSYSFEASRRLGNSPMQGMLAVYCPNSVSRLSQEVAIGVNRSEHDHKIVRIFEQRDEAMAWLQLGLEQIRCATRVDVQPAQAAK